MKNLILFLGMAFLLSVFNGCATNQPPGETKEFLATTDSDVKVVEIRDKFYPDASYLAATPIKKENPLFGPTIMIEPRYYLAPQGGFYVLRYFYIGETWGFFDEMILLIGQSPYSATPVVEPSREVIYGGQVMEDVLFRVPTDVFEKILQQREIEVRVAGRMKYDYKLESGSIAILRILREKAQQRDSNYHP